jgi:predicted CoA-binding protein
MQTIAILGASEDPSRYSNLACRTLQALGHKVYAVSLHGNPIHNTLGVKRLHEIPEPIDTLTLYLNPANQQKLLPEILALSPPPKRVIFNPGSESDATERALHAAGIETLHACTLVMASTGQF